MCGTQGEVMKRALAVVVAVALVVIVAYAASCWRPKSKVEDGGQWKQQVAFAGVSPEETKRQRQEYTDRCIINVVYEASHNPENFLAYGPSATLGKLDSAIVEERLAEEMFDQQFQPWKPQLETPEETRQLREPVRLGLQKARRRLAEVESQTFFEKLWAGLEASQGREISYSRARELWREEIRSSKAYVADCEEELQHYSREYVLQCHRSAMEKYPKEVALQAKAKAKVVKILRESAE
jgi:hypothetical protein